MKILFVDGEEFAALMFEEKYEDLQDAYADVLSSGGRMETSDFNVDLMEFGFVDPAFIDLIRDRMFDYDNMKHTNIYVVES